MSVEFGSDITSITAEDGTEYFMEILSTVEYNGFTYLAVIPAEAKDPKDMVVSILKSVEEDGENILSAVEDEEELEAVYSLIMDQLYEEEDSDDE